MQGDSLFELNSGITKYKIINRVYYLEKEHSNKVNFHKLKFRKIDSLKSNFTSTTLKILKKYHSR
jgi:hypothetical protein